MDAILLPYARSQTYALDYLNCKRMAAFLVLRGKEIPLSPDCLQVWVYVIKGS